MNRIKPLKPVKDVISHKQQGDKYTSWEKSILSDLINNLNMENIQKLRDLSVEKFEEILKHGGEIERFALLEYIEKAALTLEDTFFFYVSEGQYEEHRKDRNREAHETGDQFFDMGKHTYIAPLSLYRLFNNIKRGLNGPMKYQNLQVTIGTGSITYKKGEP